MSYLMAIGIGQYLTYVESTYIRTVNNMGTWSYVSYSRNWYQSLVNGLAECETPGPAGCGSTPLLVRCCCCG